MKTRAKQILILYFSSWWIPATITLIAWVSLIGTTVILYFLHDILVLEPRQRSFILQLLLIVSLISSLSTLSAGIWNFIKKRFVKGILNFFVGTFFSMNSIPAILLLIGHIKNYLTKGIW